MAIAEGLTVYDEPAPKDTAWEPDNEHGPRVRLNGVVWELEMTEHMTMDPMFGQLTPNERWIAYGITAPVHVSQACDELYAEAEEFWRADARIGP